MANPYPSGPSTPQAELTSAGRSLLRWAQWVFFFFFDFQLVAVLQLGSLHRSAEKHECCEYFPESARNVIEPQRNLLQHQTYQLNKKRVQQLTAQGNLTRFLPPQKYGSAIYFTTQKTFTASTPKIQRLHFHNPSKGSKPPKRTSHNKILKRLPAGFDPGFAAGGFLSPLALLIGSGVKNRSKMLRSLWLLKTWPMSCQSVSDGSFFFFFWGGRFGLWRKACWTETVLQTFASKKPTPKSQPRPATKYIYPPKTQASKATKSPPLPSRAKVKNPAIAFHRSWRVTGSPKELLRAKRPASLAVSGGDVWRALCLLFHGIYLIGL